MNTHTLRSSGTWPRDKTSSKLATTVRTVFFYSSRMILADAPALAIIVAAAWAIGSEQSAHILQAIIWAAGFVFMALALEVAQTKRSIGLLLTGLALPVIALLSSHVAVEFAVVGATLIAAWVVAALLRRSG
jgi:dolichyl-phosphate-mannose--protein O-mannosyl transferase